MQRGELVVTIRAGKTKRKLDAGTIQKVIDEISPDISSTRNFPGHKVASRFYRLFTDSNNTERGAGIHKIKTDIGTCEVRYRQSEVTATKIALCRNGMWITESIPSVKSQDFASENVAFEALLLCDATDSPRDLSYLIRMAEGNLHNELQMNGIANQEDKRDLRKALQKIREELKNLIDKQDEKDNWFVGVGADGLIRTAPDVEKIGPVDSPGSDTGKRSKNSSKTKKDKTKKSSSPRPGKGLQVRCIAVRNNDTMKIRAVMLASSPDIELRLALNGGGDFSCDSPTADNQRIVISEVMCDGDSYPVDGEGAVARIGAVKEGDVKEIVVKFIEPKVHGDYKVNCEFARRAVVPTNPSVS